MAAPHPIPGVTGGRDETGVITVTLPWWCDTFAECFSVGDSSLSINGNRIPELRRDFGVWDPDTTLAGYQIGVTYQGPDFSLDLSKVERFGFDAEYSEQPIETHHAIDILLNKYGGRLVDGGGGEKRLVFGETVNAGESAGAGAGGFSGGDASGEGERNPNFGIKSYPQYESVWSHTYLVKRLSKDFLDRISTTVDSPPGKPPTPKGRNWLIMVPGLEIFPQDTGFRVTDFYKLSKPGGWPPAMTRLRVI